MVSGFKIPDFTLSYWNTYRVLMNLGSGTWILKRGTRKSAPDLASGRRLEEETTPWRGIDNSIELQRHRRNGTHRVQSP